MKPQLIHIINCAIAAGLKTTAWLKYGRKYASPLEPDRLLWLDPKDIEQKSTEKPPSDRVPPTLVVGGTWDRNLEPIEDDVVYRSLNRRFLENRPWEETGYVEYLRTDESEHGGVSREKALERCESIDDLYRYLESNGYRTQKQLRSDGDLLNGWADSIRPPAYDEIAVNITRNGEFLWHAGMHRLVIAQLLEIPKVPVRVHTRHARWQDTRERFYNGADYQTFDGHPDLSYLR